MHLVDRHRRVERVGVVLERAPAAAAASASTTIDAVEGRISAANATGSDFSGSSWPSRPTISYLYLSPARAPGTKISQKPLPRTRMAWRRPSQ